ncbi:hypothetical protein HYU14_06380, partial [Candidatus Woesearchaeota archaeon]|nr:hypothetical protein [Candidatus Woesearchaeota archaeon]
MRHNGQSIYRINDKARTRQEIIDLLSLAKIEPDGYNIILQGDITHFVEMPPMERRLLIEEIAGISVYEDKKQKAMSQLEKVGERLKEAEIILAERNTYLKELKKDRDEAAKFKDLADKVTQNKATLLHIQIKKVEKKKSAFQEDLEKAKKELQKKNDEVKNLRGLIAKGKDDIAFISKEIEEKGEVEQVSLNHEIESLKISLAKNTTRLETLHSEIARIGKRRQDLKENQQELDGKIRALRSEITEQQKKKKTLDDEKEMWASKVAVFKDKN